MTVMRAGQRIVNIPGIGMNIPRRAVSAAGAVSWWLAGGVSAANAIGVYQPKGAASLAASYSNLANPGTYDAAPGTAPAWAAGTGWQFVRGLATYLTTGVEFASPVKPTVIVRYSDFVPWWASFLGGQEPGGAAWNKIANVGMTASARYASLVVTPIGATAEPGASGVLAVAGGYGYLDGVVNTALMTQLDRPTAEIYIGSHKTTAGAAADPITANFQAVAIYNTTLSGPQVAAVSAAMALL